MNDLLFCPLLIDIMSKLTIFRLCNYWSLY